MASKQDDVYSTFIAEINSVGHLALDEMNEHFRELLEAFHECDDRECVTALAAVREQLVRLGIAEHEWMSASGNPNLERQRYEQLFWLEVVDEVRQRVQHGDIQIARWLASELSHWFEVHSRETDSALVDFLQSRRDARCILGERGYTPRRAPRILNRGG